MTTYPAISLHQPWATLCGTEVPCPSGCINGHLPDPKCRCTARSSENYSLCPHEPSQCPCGRWDGPAPMVKRFETRSRPCPPKYIGQRIAIHAAKHRPQHLTTVGEWSIHVPPYVDEPELRRLGAVAKGELLADRYARGLATPMPLGAVVATAVIARSLPIRTCTDREPHVCLSGGYGLLAHSALLDPFPDGATEWVIDDQLPYGDWSPGRWAWELIDVVPLDEPVPWKGRQGWFTVELPA